MGIRFKSIALATSLTAITALSLGNPAYATFSDSERKDIEKIIHEYIVSHPEVIVEAAQVLEKQKAAKEEVNLQAAIEFLLHDKNTPSLGSDKAKHYIIEFFDYNCGYCKVVRKHVKRLVKEEDIRLISVELPILSPLSVKASAIGLALYHKDKDLYFKYQDHLMALNKKVDSEDVIKDAVKAVGANYEELDKEVNANPKIRESLGKNMEIAGNIGVQGTPFFIIDGKVIRGAVRDYAVLVDLLDKKEK